MRRPAIVVGLLVCLAACAPPPVTLPGLGGRFELGVYGPPGAPAAPSPGSGATPTPPPSVPATSDGDGPGAAAGASATPAAVGSPSATPEPVFNTSNGGSGGGGAPPPTPAPLAIVAPSAGAFDDPGAPEAAAVDQPATAPTTARAWRPADVFSFGLTLLAFDDAHQAFEPLVPPASLTLGPDAQPPLQARLAAATPGRRYRVDVLARGNEGGTAADQALNLATPASAELDLRSAANPRELTIPVPLDPRPFAAELVLPSNQETPGSLPAWCTGLVARLKDAATPAATLATASWLPGGRASFVNVRGDKPYTLELDVTSAAGTRTSTLGGYTVPREDGQALRLVVDFGAIEPPTGTLLARYTFAGGAAGVVVDPAERVWVTNQTGGSVSALGFDGAAQPGSPFTLSGQPRAMAVDPASGDVWVVRTTGSQVTRFVDGAQEHTYAAGSFPSGVAVDAFGNPWIASLFGNSVQALAPDGTRVRGPFAVGQTPGAVAVDPGTGDVFVANVDGNSVTRIQPDDGVSTIALPVGMKPGGIAVDAAHVLWVVGNGDGRLRRFHADGTAVGAATNLGPGITAIAIDATSGIAWVGASNGQRLLRLGADAALLGNYACGAFPTAIALDPRGHVWVAGGGALAEHAP